MNKNQFIEENLKLALESDALDKQFGQKLEQSLHAEIESRISRKTQSRPLALRLGWVFGVLIFVLLSVTLILGPDRVWAQVQRLLSYFPGVGFVDPESVMVLDGPVAQQGPGRTLTIKNSLIQDGVVKIWAEFSGQAQNPGEVWLTTADGGKIKGSWSYEPDVQGTNGILFEFHTELPAQTITALMTESGWNLPLSYQPGTDSFPPAANASLPGQETCQNSNNLRICAISNHFQEDSLEVLLEFTSEDGRTHPYAEISGLDYRDILPTLDTTPVLIDDSGNRFTASFLRQPAIQTGDKIWTTTLLFEGLSSEKTTYRLELPGLMVTYPFSDVVSVDVGSDPKAGQSFLLDKTITVQGLKTHFDHAELISGGPGDLTLMAYMPEIDLNQDKFILGFEQGIPDNGQDMYGTFFDGSKFALTMEIGRSKGSQSGIIRMNVISAIIFDSTRVEIPITVNDSSLELVMTSIPHVVDGLQTPQVMQALDMSRFSETGEVIQKGDILYSAAAAESSSLYALTPDQKEKSRLIATVPGNVLNLFLMQDGTLYYTVGEILPGSDFGQPKQLYRYSQGNGQPELIFSEFGSNIDPTSLSISHQGSYLSFRTYEQVTGLGTEYRSKIVRLDRCEGGICPVNVVEGFGEFADWQFSVGARAWSPTHDQLLLTGTSKDPDGNVHVDLFLFDLESYPAMNQETLGRDNGTSLANAFWSLDGESIYLLRRSGAPADNTYGLEKIMVKDKSVRTIAAQLPWNMSEVIELKNGSLLDASSVLDPANQQMVIRRYQPEAGIETMVWNQDFVSKSEMLREGGASAGGNWIVFRSGSQSAILFDLARAQFVKSALCQTSMPVEYCTYTWMP